MKLLWALFRWLVSQSILIVFLTALIVFSVILTDWWSRRKEQETLFYQLQEQLEKTTKEFRALQTDLSLENRYLQLREQEPSRWTSPLQWLRWQKEMDVMAGLLDRKNQELKKLRAQKVDLLTKVKTAREDLYRIQELLRSTLKKSLVTIVSVALIVLFGPLLLSAFHYYVLAGLAGRAKSIVLVKSSSADDASFTAKPGQKSCELYLTPGECLLARMDWIQQYPPAVRKRTRFFWDIRSPFLSYASGLFELTEIKPTEIKEDENESPASVLLASSRHPDSYLSEVEMIDHPGVVVTPSQIVATSGNLRIKTRWCLFSPHSWIAGRLRYILFSGTGKIIIESRGGIEPHLISQPLRISESVVAAFEGHLPFSTVRTETFWPYYRRKTPLFDFEFHGNGFLLRQIASPHQKQGEPGLVRLIDGIFNGLSKLLGF